MQRQAKMEPSIPVNLDSEDDYENGGMPPGSPPSDLNFKMMGLNKSLSQENLQKNLSGSSSNNEQTHQNPNIESDKQKNDPEFDRHREHRISQRVLRSKSSSPGIPGSPNALSDESNN